VMDARKVAMAVALYREATHSPQEICAALRISKTTLYRYLAAARAEPPPAESVAG
jgi:Homeodomain-like domain